MADSSPPGPSATARGLAGIAVTVVITLVIAAVATGIGLVLGVVGDRTDRTLDLDRATLVPVVVARHPHDPTAWTQGLEWYGDRLVESTGLENESSLRIVDLETGGIEEIIALDGVYGEGVTVVDGTAFQLTWKDRVLLTTELEPVTGLSERTPARRADAYRGEGWGLCYDGRDLVMSDGSSQLVRRDPATFAITATIDVELDGEPVDRLNELECVEGRIWANIWLENAIVSIDGETGTVVEIVDAESLVPAGYEDRSDDVLNGIAFDPERGTFFLTGKRWPVLYEVTFEPKTEGR